MKGDIVSNPAVYGNEDGYPPRNPGPMTPPQQPPANPAFPPDEGVEVINLDDDRRPVKPTTWH
jgi:hypothetical protein